MKKGAKKHVAASATLSLGENSYEHLERIRGKKRKKASKEQNVVVLQEEVTSALLPTAANILPQGWGNYSENEAEKEYHGKSTPGKLLFADVLVKHEVKDLQFQLQNDDYPQLFDLERECRNCQVLKFENSNLKIELERQNRIIDGLLPKKKKFIDDEKNKTKDYESQRSLSRKRLAEKIGHLSRALYVGRLMHALPFPSVDDVKNCFNSLIEFLDSLNLTDAGHLLNINTRRDIQRFICIEDDRCFTHCLNEIDTIIKSRLLNANFDFEAKSVLHVLGKLRSNIVDSILDKILLNLNIPFKMIKRRNKLVVVADKDNSFMSVFVNDEMLHPEFWVNDRLMCLKKSIQDSIPSFPLRNIDLYLSECNFLIFAVYSVSLRLLRKPASRQDFQIFKTTFVLENVLRKDVDESGTKSHFNFSLDSTAYHSSTFYECLERTRSILSIDKISTFQPSRRWKSVFRGKIIDGIFRIIQKRFDKDVTSLDLKYGGEWLCLGLMTISLLKKHGGFSTLEEQLSDWMRSLCKQFQFFPLLEKLYALWACSNVSSPVYNCVSEDEEREFTKEFKRNGTTLLLQRGIGSKPKKSQLEKISAMNDTGVDLVNGYFCRKVCIRDNNKTFRASDFVQAFSTASVEFSVFSHTLKHYLEELSKFKDLTIRTNGFWTLLFYATHVILIETDYMTNHDPVSSEISSFISEFCIIAGQNKAIQMADSLSEILLCVEKIEKNQPAIFMMTNILINMISSEGVLLQNDNGLGEREDLHSKLTSCSALISVLIYIDSEK